MEDRTVGDILRHHLDVECFADEIQGDIIGFEDAEKELEAYYRKKFANEFYREILRDFLIYQESVR